MKESVAEARQRIDTACQKCFQALERYRSAANSFQEERRQIGQSPYIQEEKERQTGKAAERLTAGAEAEYTALHEGLEEAKTAAVELERLLDIGEELRNTLSVVTALGRYIPVRQRVALVEPFKGQMQALALLRAAYESVEIDPEVYFHGLMFDTAARVDELDRLARRLTLGGSPADMLQFAAELEKFAAALGVELTARFCDVADTTETLAAAVRVSAGLKAAD